MTLLPRAERTEHSRGRLGELSSRERGEANSAEGGGSNPPPYPRGAAEVLNPQNKVRGGVGKPTMKEARQ